MHENSEATCEACGARLAPMKPTGRPRRYCGSGCRVRALRIREALARDVTKPIDDGARCATLHPLQTDRPTGESAKRPQLRQRLRQSALRPVDEPAGVRS